MVFLSRNPHVPLWWLVDLLCRYTKNDAQLRSAGAKYVFRAGLNDPAIWGSQVELMTCPSWKTSKGIPEPADLVRGASDPGYAAELAERKATAGAGFCHWQTFSHVTLEASHHKDSTGKAEACTDSDKQKCQLTCQMKSGCKAVTQKGDEDVYQLWSGDIQIRASSTSTIYFCESMIQNPIHEMLLPDPEYQEYVVHFISISLDSISSSSIG